MGYTGGDSEAPTYQSVCNGDGHTEALKIEYDPSVVSYEELLDVFFSEHTPTTKAFKEQYKSAIWPQSDAQREAALAKIKALEDKFDVKIQTDIEAAKPWYDAEEYHQKYIQKQGALRGIW